MFGNLAANRLTLKIIQIGSNFEPITKTSKMIKQISRVALMGVLLAALTAFTVGFKTIKIQTSAVCGMCKDRIEGTLGALDGVEEARLDLTTKKVKVKYDDSKQSEASLKAVLTKIGYAADELSAEEAAFNALPGCCKSAAACSASKASASNVEGAAKACSSEAKTASATKACAKGASAGKACCASKATGSASVDATTTAAPDRSSSAPAKACCSGAKAKACSKGKAEGTK